MELKYYYLEDPRLYMRCVWEILMSTYHLVFRKACHLLVEMEHRAYLVVKHLNMDLTTAKEQRMLQLNELDEFPMNAYENAKLHKKRTKKLRDKYI